MDKGAHGGAQFLTTTQITGETMADLPPAALARMICFYLVGHLNEKSLLAASEWLADIYARQVREPQFVQKIPETRFLSVSGVDSVERTPFVFDDE